METKLNLIKSLNEDQHKSKVVLPHFPFCYLTFKCSASPLAYEVTDLSYTGMQLSLKNGEHSINDHHIKGELHWHGEALAIEAEVKWQTNSRMGVEFSKKSNGSDPIENFLNLDRMAKNMRAVHKMDIPIEFPAKLKFWLRADGPLELFVWRYDHSEISKFQFLLLNHYIEWTDGQGLKTGKLFSKRDLNTPLIDEDEFTFIMDQAIQQERLNLALQMLDKLDPERLSPEVIEFLHLKLRH